MSKRKASSIVIKYEDDDEEETGKTTTNKLSSAHTKKKNKKNEAVKDHTSKSPKGKKVKVDQKPVLHKHNERYHYFDDDEELEQYRANLLNWYDEHKRSLPWRFEEVNNSKKNNNLTSEEANNRAYAIWVSEIMLQQTRVQTVIDYFTRWIKKWPTVQDLAKATLEEVNEMWSGLGYYRRAKFLHSGAQRVVEQYHGILPTTAKELEDIPGIGKYTAGAIASIAFGEVSPLVDGNVVRVLSRLRSIGIDQKSKTAIKLHWDLAERVVDPVRPGSFNQALMELGATVCTPTTPLCKRVSCEEALPRKPRSGEK